MFFKGRYFLFRFTFRRFGASFRVCAADWRIYRELESQSVEVWRCLGMHSVRNNSRTNDRWKIPLLATAIVEIIKENTSRFVTERSAIVFDPCFLNSLAPLLFTTCGRKNDKLLLIVNPSVNNYENENHRRVKYLCNLWGRNDSRMPKLRWKQEAGITSIIKLKSLYSPERR